MIVYEDYIHLSKLKYNDILNTGNNISGQAVITRKHFFILPEKQQDPIGMITRNLYDKEYFLKASQSFDKVNLVEFKTELISILPPRYVIPLANIESFEVSVGFFYIWWAKIKTKRREEGFCIYRKYCQS